MQENIQENKKIIQEQNKIQEKKKIQEKLQENKKIIQETRKKIQNKI